LTFTLDAEVAAVLQAAVEKNGPPPTLPARLLDLSAQLAGSRLLRQRPRQFLQAPQTEGRL
jgi:hypothetical protein